MNSRIGYILTGVCGGLALGIFALMDAEDLGLWVFVIGGAGGGIIGAVLYSTQAWEVRGPGWNLLRWTGGGALAGFVLALAAAAIGAIPFQGIPAGVGCGLVVGLGFELTDQQRHLFANDGYRARTRDEIVVLWVVVIGAIVGAFGLFALSWRLTT